MSSSPRRKHKFVPSALTNFLQTEAAGGIVLLIGAVLALIVANSNWRGEYEAFLETHLAVNFGLKSFAIDLSVEDWIKDGLMTIFFFVVGLELKRELVNGELSDPKSVILPIGAAIGGMIVPALVYLVFNFGGEAGGWPIPVATDIAFAVAALAVMGRGAPASLRIFLLTLAIVDDLGAVVLIALVFSHGIIWMPFIATLAMLAALALLARWRAAPAWVFVAGAFLVWLFALKSGVHTSVAGVAAAFTVPIAARREGGDSILAQLEHALHPVTAFGVLPIFAFAAAGVPLAGLDMQTLLSSVPVGVALGLALGKPAGVLLASLAVIRLKWAKLPAGAGWSDMAAAACLCGIGFTMSLFLAALAFEHEPLAQAEARLGVLAGSAGAVLLAALSFAIQKRKSHRT